MKKFLAATILVAALIFGGIQTTFAQDVYIQSDSRGDIYIVTESIDTNGVDYVNVTLKFIQNGRLAETEHRQYAYVDGEGHWWVSSEEAQRDKLRPIRVWNPATDKVLMFCLNHR